MNIATGEGMKGGSCNRRRNGRGRLTKACHCISMKNQPVLAASLTKNVAGRQQILASLAGVAF